MAAAKGDLGSREARWKPGASCYVVLAAKGYPERPEMGTEIFGLERVHSDQRRVVFHAGTRRQEQNYYVSGGRVLGVGAGDVSVDSARRLCYDTISIISAAGCHFRRDIGTAARVALGAGVEVKPG